MVRTRYCFENRKDVTRSIQKCQKTLDKMHIKFNVQKELRGKSPDDVFAIVEAKLGKYIQRVNMEFMAPAVEAMVQEYYLDRATQLFIEEFPINNAVSIIRDFSVLNFFKDLEEGMLYTVESNCTEGYYCIAFTKIDHRVWIDTDMFDLKDRSFKHNQQLAYDIVNEHVYVICDDTIKDDVQGDCVKVKLKVTDDVVRDAWDFNSSWLNYKLLNESDVLSLRGMHMRDAAITAIVDYRKTMEDVARYARPSTVEKHRAKRENLPISVIDKPTVSKERRQNVGEDKYVKLSTIVRKKTGTMGTGTRHSSHASPRPHDRSSHPRHLKDGRVIPVRGCRVNKDKEENGAAIAQTHKVIVLDT